MKKTFKYKNTSWEITTEDVHGVGKFSVIAVIDKFKHLIDLYNRYPLNLLPEQS